MARRAGKAASRKARQRQVKRPSVPAGPTAPVAVPPVGTPDARAATSLAPPRRTASATPTGSVLTDRERAEYHYVERDLRNIGVLTVVMIGLLLVAWLVFTATGLVH
ncbi:MAG TPA: hypothetical protein VFN76_10500 [Candidatus Limnocylindria bacterium]|nr:hypothetical protein [Candidatus Limnocylindria bacterium]